MTPWIIGAPIIALIAFGLIRSATKAFTLYAKEGRTW